MSSSIGLNSNPKMIAITIHRCSNIPRKRGRGAYFVKVAIGDKNIQTRECSSSRGQVVWDERLNFGGVEASSMTLSLYRVRTLSFLDPELSGEVTTGLLETQDGSPSSGPSTLSFPQGPTIELSLTISGICDVIEQAQQGLKPLEGGWKRLVEGLGMFCEMTSPVAGANTFAQLAYGILSSISKPLTKEHERDGRIESLLNSFIDFYDLVKDSRHAILTASDELQDILKRISLQMVEVAFFVRDYYGSGKFLKRALKNTISTADETIQGYTSTLEGLKEELRFRLGLQTGVTIKRVEITVVRVLEEIGQISQSLNLDDLDYARGAGFNADKICLTGTRTGVLQDMAQWVSLDSSQILLLLGGAGTGKSTIAHTLASQFSDLGRLGSMFCFSESEKTTRKPITLFPHIARDLADLDKNIRQELFNVAPTKAERTTSSINDQLKKLVVAPANAIREKLHGPIVIIIDALDESGTAEERRDLLRILASRLNELPPNFKIIITSRPNADICEAFPEGPDFVIKRMGDIPQIFTGADIVAYVDKLLEGVSELDSKMRQNIASHATGLFEWARVGCQFIRSHRLGGSVLSRYEAVTRPFQSNTRHGIYGDDLLDELYHTVLSRALPLDEEGALKVFRFVVAQVLTTFEPLSYDSLNKLFQVSRLAPQDCKAYNVVGYLVSILSGVDMLDAPIAPFHTSFRDFLTNPTRSKGFFIDLRATDIHTDMAWSCLSVMAKELKFNICHLETSYLENKAIPDLDERIKKYIPPHLLYACRFWSSHLCSLPVSLPSSDRLPGDNDKDRIQLMKRLDEVLSHSLLYWLEVLSVTDTVNIGVQQLRQVDSWIQNIRNGDSELVSLIGDIVRFSSYSAKCIARSAPHIYISALSFGPKKSLVARKYTRSNDNTLAVAIGKRDNYPSCLNILHGHTGEIRTVAFSPDGSRIASGSHDRTIRVWNAEDGTMALGPLRGHTDEVSSVSFSPDGSQIVSGSFDCSIRLWNANDGTIILKPFHGHTKWVWVASFSPDGSRIVSCSNDCTIRVWNAQDGTLALKPFHGHTNEVWSVAFSPDGSRIVSGSLDGTVRVWNAEDGTMALRPFQGHTHAVNSVSFSPDCSRIVSAGYDSTIRVWNAEDGTMALGPLRGHTNKVSFAAFSPNGSKIVSGSHDHTIRVWNAQDGTMAFEPFQGHSNAVWLVAFSPDGSRIASASRDCTIRLWNAEGGTIDLEPLQDYTNSVKTSSQGFHNITGDIRSVAFSPDGSRIVSGSFDCAIRVWNTEDGTMALEPFQGHTGEVSSVSFSPDGSRIISGSFDCSIRVWNAQDGTMALKPIQGHTKWVWVASFSPDGSRIVSCSNDRTIRVWNAQDGTPALKPIYGHTNEVWSAAFSPDGSRIVSGSLDGTIRVWNAENGTMVLSPLQGHTHAVSSVSFSPDGSRILSAGYDSTIRVWNAEDGKMVLGPLKGHTNMVSFATFSPDGSRIASGSHDHTIRVWNAHDGTMAFEPLQGHVNTVWMVAFSLDGSRILSSSRDYTVRVWNAEASTTPLGPLQAHTDFITPGIPLHGRVHTLAASFKTQSHHKTPSIPGSSSNQPASASALVPFANFGALSVQDILPQFNWRIEDGWALGPHGELLFYVPPVHRPCLWGPRTTLLIGRDVTKLDMSRFAHGIYWTKAFNNRSSGSICG